jgi:hypothetical protein
MRERSKMRENSSKIDVRQHGHATERVEIKVEIR